MGDNTIVTEGFQPKEQSTEYNKVIFLDIEGVVVTHRSILVQHCVERGETYHGGRSGWHRFIDPIAIGLIYKLAKDYRAQIVLTSTLRGLSHTYSGLCAVAPHWLEDATELLSFEHTRHASSREEEIEDFIRLHNVNKYVVIDDRRLHSSSFVWCNPRDGFTYDNYHQSRVFLADEPGHVAPELIFL